MLNQNTNRSGNIANTQRAGHRRKLRGTKGILLLAAAALACTGLPSGAGAETIQVTLDPWSYNTDTGESNKVVIVSTGELSQRHTPHLVATFRNLESQQITFKVNWRDRGPLEQWLCADVLTITGLTGKKAVLEMSYDEHVYNPVMDKIWSQTGEETIYVLTGHGPAHKGGWEALWSVNAQPGGVFPMPQNAWPSNGLWNFQGTWIEAYYKDRAGAFTPGAFGVDYVNGDFNGALVDGVVWSVINQDGVYAPEPGTLILLLGGAIPVIRNRRSRAANKSSRKQA